MRRRRSGLRTLSAEDLVRLHSSLVTDAAGLSPAVAARVIQSGLADAGYDVVQAIRARRWLRQGRPASYVWDDSQLAVRSSVSDVEQWVAPGS